MSIDGWIYKDRNENNKADKITFEGVFKICN